MASRNDKQQRVDLDAAAGFLLEECRMVLPGIQVLFGFQLIAVFNDRFREGLTSGEQALHYAALILVAAATGLVMAPAAIHRRARHTELTDRFIKLASRLLLVSMFPLAAALCAEVYLVGRLILDDRNLSAVFALVVFVVLMALWVALPAYERRRRSQ